MMKVWPVKHSPLLRQPERFIARDELKSLIQKVTHSLVNIHDKTGEFLLRLDDGRVIDTKGWAGWEWQRSFRMDALSVLSRAGVLKHRPERKSLPDWTRSSENSGSRLNAAPLILCRLKSFSSGGT